MLLPALLSVVLSLVGSGHPAGVPALALNDAVKLNPAPDGSVDRTEEWKSFKLKYSRTLNYNKKCVYIFLVVVLICLDFSCTFFLHGIAADLVLYFFADV